MSEPDAQVFDVYPEDKYKKAFAGYNFEELKHLAARASLPRKLVVDAADETISLFLERWPAEKGSLPLEPRVVETIDRHLQKLPIVNRRG